MAHLTPFDKTTWLMPESFNAMRYTCYNWSLVGKQGRDQEHIRLDLLETAIGLGSYVITTYFYPGSSLPILGCLVSTLSPNATRWGTGTYMFVTGLKNAWGGGPPEAVIKNIAWAVLGYLVTTPTPKILMNQIVKFLGEQKKIDSEEEEKELFIEEVDVYSDEENVDSNEEQDSNLQSGKLEVRTVEEVKVNSNTRKTNFEAESATAQAKK